MQTTKLRNTKKTLTIVIAVLAIIMFVVPCMAGLLNNNLKVNPKQKENIATVKDDEFLLNPTTNSKLIENNPKNEKDGYWKYRISNDTYNKYDKYIKMVNTIFRRSSPRKDSI